MDKKEEKEEEHGKDEEVWRGRAGGKSKWKYDDGEEETEEYKWMKIRKLIKEDKHREKKTNPKKKRKKAKQIVQKMR